MYRRDNSSVRSSIISNVFLERGMWFSFMGFISTNASSNVCSSGKMAIVAGVRNARGLPKL